MTVAEQIISTSQNLGVDPKLSLEVAIQESGLDQNARSGAGAIGIFQLMPATAKILGVDPTDAVQNIQGGVTYLRDMLNQFGGSIELALAAYNAGPGRVNGALKAVGGSDGDWLSQLPAETQNYVAKITGRLNSQYTVTSLLPVPVAAAAAVASAVGPMSVPVWAWFAGALVLVYFLIED